jgi:hypothetical protein
MVWDPTTQTLIQTLENVQRRAARFVINDYTSGTPGCMTSMLTSLEWQTLEQQRRISRLVMMYRSSINSHYDTVKTIYMGTWAYWLAWLTCWRLALNSSMELAPTVVFGRWFHSRTVLWKKEFLRVS